MFRWTDIGGFRFSLFAGSGRGAGRRKGEPPFPATLPFWLQPDSIFGWLVLTAFNESSLGLTMPSTLAPPRMMLAGAPSPRGSSARPQAVGPLSEGSLTVCCLAALPRRVRLMGQPVGSGLCPARQSFKWLHVAAPSEPVWTVSG